MGDEFVEACSAALGGVVTTAITYPLDSTKVRVQASAVKLHYCSMLFDGIKNPAMLYRGFVAKVHIKHLDVCAG